MSSEPNSKLESPKFTNYINPVNPIFPTEVGPPLNKILITDSLYSQCNICLLYYIKIYYTDICRHYMCSKFIKAWTQIKMECPVCKRVFSKIFLKYLFAKRLFIIFFKRLLN